MTATAGPEAALSVLPRADGSATYSHAGYTVTASVNGPIEAQRRDEHPYEAHVDVIVRPAAGVGGTRERHLESVLEPSLSQIILVKNFPRSLIQIVLQIESAPVNDYVNNKIVQAGINIPVIPVLLQTAVLALLSASVPMSTTATATVLAVLPAKEEGASPPRRIVADPSQRDLAAAASSVHVLAFTSDGSLLLAESQGDFTIGEWDDVYAAAQRICCESGRKAGLDMVMGDDDDDEDERDGPDMRQFLRSTMEAKVEADLHWKASS